MSVGELSALASLMIRINDQERRSGLLVDEIAKHLHDTPESLLKT
jgi:hypothetical protein